MSIAKWFLAAALLTAPALAVELTAPDGQPISEFGASVSVSGNTLAVSTGATVVTRPGIVYVYQKNKSWNDAVLVAELTPSDGASVFLNVAVSGPTIVVGASYCGGVANQGCVYVFVEGAQGWKNAHETAQLISSDRIVNDWFGTVLAINVNTVVVGAAFAGNPVQQQAVGEAYEFTRPAGGWVNMTETAKLLPSDGHPGDQFGFTVAVNGAQAVSGGGRDDVRSTLRIPGAARRLDNNDGDGAVDLWPRNRPRARSRSDPEWNDSSGSACESVLLQRERRGLPEAS
jgi:hypothetical protein